MLTSLALIFLIGMMLGSIFNKLKLPSLLGMIKIMEEGYGKERSISQ